jgi:hypothetical protein
VLAGAGGWWMTKVGGGWRFGTVENCRDFVGFVWKMYSLLQ